MLKRLLVVLMRSYPLIEVPFCCGEPVMVAAQLFDDDRSP
jgi:hypothetical protein